MSRSQALANVLTGTIIATTGPGQACLFLDLLPPETRLIIYRYLLVAKYTKREHDMNSEEYNRKRSRILAGSDHSYQFHPSILGANHQIRREAYDLFERENDFILFSCRDGYWRHSFFEDCGLAMLATYKRSKGLLKIVTIVSMSSRPYDTSESDTEFVARCGGRVCTVDDLERVCARLRRGLHLFDDEIPDLKIRITLSRHIQELSREHQDEHPPIWAKLRSILHPLESLQGIDNAEVFGLKDTAYEQRGLLRFRDEQTSLKEMIRKVEKCFDQGDKASTAGDQDLAISGYKSALAMLSYRSRENIERYEVILGGRFNGRTIGWAQDDAKVKLHTLVAAAYLGPDKSSLARIYVERMYYRIGSMDVVDGRLTPLKFPLDVSPDHAYAYASLLVVAAQISSNHGKLREATRELNEALRIDPLNRVVERRLKELDESPLHLKCERRIIIQNKQRASFERKDESA